jgi:hypothetical protein
MDPMADQRHAHYPVEGDRRGRFGEDAGPGKSEAGQCQQSRTNPPPRIPQRWAKRSQDGCGAGDQEQAHHYQRDIEQPARGVKIARPVSDEGWGLLSAVRMPSGAELQLYVPRHFVAYGRS